MLNDRWQSTLFLLFFRASSIKQSNKYFEYKQYCEYEQIYQGVKISSQNTFFFKNRVYLLSSISKVAAAFMNTEKRMQLTMKVSAISLKGQVVVYIICAQYTRTNNQFQCTPCDNDIVLSITTFFIQSISRSFSFYNLYFCCQFFE